MTAPLASPHLVDDRLDDYVDGMLDAPSRDATRAHLAACASCAARLGELRALLTSAAAERRRVEPPAELWPLVVASTVHQPRLRRQLLRSMRAPLVAAAVVLIVLSSATTAWIVTRLPMRSPVGAAAGAPAERERVVKEIRPALGRAPGAPGAPEAPRAPAPE